MAIESRLGRLRVCLAVFAVASLGLAGCADGGASDGAARRIAHRSDTGSADLHSSLSALVAPPDSAIIQMYIDAGATQATAHAITDRERKLVETALAGLPPLHRAVLERHLARLSFIDAPASAGTGLTRELDGEGPRPLFDITLRADVLDMSLSEFLTVKEARLFEDDGSGVSVRIEAGSTPALPYILLHEATHVVDGVLGVSACEESQFRQGLWAGYRELAQPHDADRIARTPFRRAPKVPASEAPALYAALEKSPFASLYATASAAEDLAELVAWRVLASDTGAQPEPQVLDSTGSILARANPLASPEVRRRFGLVDALLDIDPAAIDAGYNACRGL